METAEQARKVYERYRASLERARALGFRISAISFGSGHEPVDVRFERIPVICTGLLNKPLASVPACELGNSFTKATR